MAEFVSWDQLPVKTGATADPAAGANPAEITFANRTLFLNGLNRIVASGVANRLPVVNVKMDGTTVSMMYRGPANITDAQTIDVTLVQGTTAVRITAQAHDVGIDQGGIEMPAGTKLQLTYANLQAGDNCGPLYYTYKEVP